MNNKIIYAAGGVVRNPEGEFLLIFRRGMWDLPKGKREKGETDKLCAQREVSEECGIEMADLVVGKEICTTVHHYLLHDVSIEKRTTWFKMSYVGLPCELSPQIEEDIERVEWHTGASAKQLLAESFDTIKEVFTKATNSNISAN